MGSIADWVRFGRGGRRRVNDQEFRDRRQELLGRIAGRALALSSSGNDEILHLVVRVNPTDQELVGQDAIGDDQELCRLLRDRGRAIRVVVHEFAADVAIPRGHAEVRVAGVVRNVPPTSSIDGEDGGARLIRIGVPQKFLVPPTGGVIGRDADSCEVVVDAPTVSRRHAQLRPSPDGFVVEDLGSSNGLTINAHRTDGGQLHDGDILGLGKTVRLRLEVRRTE